MFFQSYDVKCTATFFFGPQCIIPEKNTKYPTVFCLQVKSVKSFPSHKGPQGGTDLRFCIPVSSLCCKTLDMVLMHCVVYLFTSLLSPVPIYCLVAGSWV